MSVASLLDSFRHAVREKKGRSALLGVLTAVLVVVGVRGLVSKQGGGPRTGLASPAPSSVPSVADAGRAAVSRAIASKLDATGKSRVVHVPTHPPPDRNIFALEPAHFPPQAQPVEPDPSDPSARKPAVDPAHTNADDPAEAAARLAASLIEETKGWRLKSVILGTRPLAVIEAQASGSKDGRQRSAVVHEGEEFREWRVAEISLTSVVLEKHGVSVRLTLAMPER